MNRNDKRGIEIFRADPEELRICIDDNQIEKLEVSEFIKIKGIPFDSTKDDIEKFFKGLKIAKDGIIIPLDYKYRTTRDCFVQFMSIDDAKKALELNNEPLGSR